MTRYAVRRFALLLLTLFIVATAVFALVRLLPGNAVDQMLNSNGGGSPAVRQALLKNLGLDRPVPEQYGRWLTGLLHGDFGSSLVTKQPVLTELRSRILATSQLALLALCFTVVIALPIGVLSAMYRDSILDYVLRGVAILGLAIPSFWLALLIVVLPSKYLHWTPAGAFRPLSANPFDSMTSLILPAIAIGVASGAALMRYVRAYMIEVLSQDYVRTASAKGLRWRTIVGRHAMPNTLIPVLTVLGLQIPALLGGAVIIEQIFAIPGMGSYLVDAIEKRDYPIVQAVALVIAIFVLVSNLLVDLSYGLIDPRVRAGR